MDQCHSGELDIKAVTACHKKCFLNKEKLILKSVCLSAQEKAEGEPKVKKGKTLLDDDDDDEANDEGVDESLEEVRE